jgi:AhpC/TSA family
VWQAVYEELRGHGFVVITVALDKSADDARPWIEAAHPTHPSLVDTRHVLAELYNVVNVPTVLWIDERGRIVRPNDVAFGADTFRQLTGLDASIHLRALRAWVRGEKAAFSADEARAQQTVPTAADQLARAEFGLGQWLWTQGRHEAAARHFERAGMLAPHDFTIRRGTMPMRGIDPMGPQFRAMLGEWTQAGHPYYRPLADTAGRA